MGHAARFLVAGIGNIFFGDDGFGVTVIQEVLNDGPPAGVDVIDFGIRGFDLAFALLRDYEAAILVDAMAGDGPPGTLYVMEPEEADPADPGALEEVVATHGLSPMQVLRLAQTLGEPVKRVLVLGCQPSPLPASPEELVMGLSQPVQQVVPNAIRLLHELLERLGSSTDASPNHL